MNYIINRHSGFCLNLPILCSTFNMPTAFNWFNWFDRILIWLFTWYTGNMEESRDRASQLLKMIKDAKKLKDKKSYNVEELLTKGKK